MSAAVPIRKTVRDHFVTCRTGGKPAGSRTSDRAPESLRSSLVTDAFLLPQLAIAGVLILAGVAKVRTPSDVQAGFAAMRVPRRLSGHFVRVVFPWCETVLGVLVLACWGWPLAVAGVAAAALMLVYLVLVSRVVRSGEQVECACFGTFSAGAVGRHTVIRNTLLFIGSTVVIFAGLRGGGLVPFVAAADDSAWWWLATSAFVTTAVASVLYLPAGQRNGPAESSRDSVASDEDLLDYVRLPIPYVALETQEGDRLYLRELTRTGPLLLVFISFGCSSCVKVLDQLPQWRQDLPFDVRPVVHQAAYLPADLPEGLLLDRDGEALRALDMPGYPSTVLLGADGLVAGGPVTGSSAARRLVADVVEQLAESEHAEGTERDQPADETADQEVLGHRVDSQA